MTKRSKASIAAKSTRDAIKQVVPDANRIMQELALAFPDRPRDSLVSWVEGLEREERDRLVLRMIQRIAKGIKTPEPSLKTLVDTGNLRGLHNP